MYVCICKSVTDKQIRRAAAKGVDNLYELRANLGVAAGCGKCARQSWCGGGLRQMCINGPGDS